MFVEMITPGDESELCDTPSTNAAHRIVAQTHRVDRVDILPSLVLFSLDPVAIEVGKKTVDIIGARRVSLPLVGVVGEKRLIAQIVRFLYCLSAWRKEHR